MGTHQWVPCQQRAAIHVVHRSSCRFRAGVRSEGVWQVLSWRNGTDEVLEFGVLVQLLSEGPDPGLGGAALDLLKEQRQELNFCMAASLECSRASPA